ncbi:MAG: glucose-6-phosphate dehydrogenase [Candidatus Izemoplasmatales bacterium]|nr:glucose-6-phosphate dehydrogenase [bacterium]MDZ4197592.1 glucose-6-phosphate dehydrogenase [Candidatus Izemoplasmatales bacterium]
MRTYFAIFGATGNLTFKKLLPAFAALRTQGLLPEDTKIVLVARSSHTIESYLEMAKTQMKDQRDLDKIVDLLEYFQLDFASNAGYASLGELLNQTPNSKKVFYLAVGPELFARIAEGISSAGLVKKGNDSGRIAFEKPFGDDLESAQAINAMLWQFFDESQIYRVDHYLGKEMIQNILVMRFANRLFENNWNHLSIEKVSIIAKETEGVMNRGNYYDKAGALKDMIQSHLMQMGALVAMEAPLTYDEAGIREQKVEVLNYLTVQPKHVLFGQYHGYLQEKNIPSDSQTETFVAMKAFFNTPRWYGVPFYFLTGKKLNEKVSEIRIDFKHNANAQALWPNQPILKNQLIIRVAPEEGVTVRMNVKEPGLSDHINSMKLDYCHDCNYVGNKPEAYERLLLDLMRGVSTLFTRWDEIETAWQVVDAIKKQAPVLMVYESVQDLSLKIKKLLKEDLL